MPDSETAYSLIAKTIESLREQWPHQPSLGELARAQQVSESHLQRLFTQFAGVSPKQFSQYLTKEYAKAQLRADHCVLDSAYAAGLSSASRLHDLMLRWEAMTPGQYASLGKDLTLYWAIQPCLFGWALVAETERGICHLAFWDTREQAYHASEALQQEWPQSELVQRKPCLLNLDQVFSGEHQHPLGVVAKGTPFQLKVWEALLKIPYGQRVSYQEVATAINQPSATRAVASAIARNHLAYLIPCHRVIRASGEINQYRWGCTRKNVLLGWESANREKE